MNGTAGLQVAQIERKEREGEVLMLTILVRDVDGGLAGPYKIPESETEIREMYVVHTRSLVTGEVTHGTKSWPMEEAQRIADDQNNNPEYKDVLTHWIEPAK